MPPLDHPFVSLSGEHVDPVQAVYTVRTALVYNNRRIAVLGVTRRVCPDIAPRCRIMSEEVSDRVGRLVKELVQVEKDDVWIGGLEVRQRPGRLGIASF